MSSKRKMGYAPIQDQDQEASGSSSPSSVSSVSSPEYTPADFDLSVSADQPYGSEKPKWAREMQSSSPQRHRSRRSQFCFEDASDPSHPQDLVANLVDIVKRMKTYILMSICLLLVFVIVFDDKMPTGGAFSSLASTDSSSSPTVSQEHPDLIRPPAARRIEDDILLITKVGSATVHKRLMVHLAEQPISNWYVPNRFYVSDWAVKVGNITFYDALGNVTEEVQNMEEFRRLRGELKALVESNQDLDEMSEKDGGWKLDKFKFLPMMGEAVRRFPNMKWYVMVEADTFLFWNELVRWLSMLDEKKQYLIGHPSFCDYDQKSMMFTHGGSGIVMSKGLIDASYGQDPEFEHHQDHLIKVSAFGDALLSKSFYDSKKVTLKELSPVGGNKFNSEPPRLLKFTREVWCTPIMTFHHVTPSDAAHLYDFQRRIEGRLDTKAKYPENMVVWGDIWDEFMPEFLRKALAEVHKYNRDPSLVHLENVNAEPGEVGVRAWKAIEEWDSETTDLNTQNAEDCQSVCRSHKDCLMWSWEKNENQENQREAGKCRWTSDFVRIGVTEPKKGDLTTGWMTRRIIDWRQQFGCSGRTGVNNEWYEDLEEQDPEKVHGSTAEAHLEVDEQKHS